VVDGPLAFDKAVSPEAARTKGIISPVAGVADILVVTNLEAGNMLAKQLAYLADAESAGIILGARIPIVLTSRADSPLARRASCALASLLAQSKGKRKAWPMACLHSTLARPASSSRCSSHREDKLAYPSFVGEEVRG